MFVYWLFPIVHLYIYEFIFYMFMAYIFSHQQLQFLGWGGNLFTVFLLLIIGFLFLLVGGARVSSLLPLLSSPVNAAFWFYFEYGSAFTAYFNVVSAHAGCQTKAGDMLTILDKHLYSNAGSVPGFLCDLVSHLPLWKWRTIIFSYSLSWLTFL